MGKVKEAIITGDITGIVLLVCDMMHMQHSPSGLVLHVIHVVR